MLYVSYYGSDNAKVGITDTSIGEYGVETVYPLDEVFVLAKTKTVKGVDLRTGNIRVLSMEDIISDKVSRLRLCGRFPNAGVGIKGLSIYYLLRQM